MKWEAVSFTRFFVFLLLAFIMALYQIHVFKDEYYTQIYNSSENF